MTEAIWATWYDLPEAARADWTGFDVVTDITRNTDIARDMA